MIGMFVLADVVIPPICCYSRYVCYDRYVCYSRYVVMTDMLYTVWFYLR